MTREDASALVADAMAEHFERLEARLEARVERLIAARALPPFMPPSPWTAGRHGAGTVIRHRNGLFLARRDTEAEPGVDEAWLPVLVGIAGIDVAWKGERCLLLKLELSDGAKVELEREVAMPIVRGYWEADTTYKPGDRVFRHGEWHAVAESTGVDPANEQAVEGYWIKVNAKQARAINFRLDNDGTLFEAGRAIGSLKPMVSEVFRELVEAQHGN